MKSMKTKGIGRIKKSKAYGVIGTLLLVGIVVTANMSSVNADEVSTNTSIPTSIVTNNKATASSEASSATASSEASSATASSEASSTTASSEANLTTASSEVSSATASSEASSTTAKSVDNGATGNVTNEVTTVSLGSSGFNLQYNNPIPNNANILFAVWSATNGQDDLVWYAADSSGSATAKYTGSYGSYYVHTYQSLNGKMTGLYATKVDVPKPNVQVSVTKDGDTTYKVSVSNVPVYMSSILLPTWTTANDQDDIIWYNANKSSEGNYSYTFSTAEHNLEAGEYNVHVYGISTVTNSLIGLTGTKFVNQYAFGDIAVSTALTETGISVSMPSDISKALTVYSAIWSAKNGQDDITWNRVDNSGKTSANYTGDYGTYYVHTYAVVQGKMFAINAQTINVPNPSVTAVLEKVGETGAKVTISNVPVYMSSILLPTWTSANDQDDIKWYNADKNSDGTYSYTFYAKDHNFETGHYNVHVYGQSQVTHSLVGLEVTDGIDLNFSVSQTNPSITVQNYNEASGTLQVVVDANSEVSKGIESVAVAAWSEDGQTNLHWYNSSDVVNGKVVITVDEKYHHDIDGTYSIHVYVKTTDGNTSGNVLGAYKLSGTNTVSSVSTNYKGTGIYGVSISGIYSNGSVKYAVWSEVNGQDDIRWYDAATNGNTATGMINVGNQSGTGTYYVHVYQDDNGKMFYLTSTAFNVSKSDYATPYYNQRDGRWGNTYYGYYSVASTGCVPTSLAMVFSSLKGTTVLPTDVANYLYYNTIEFDRGFAGASGQGIMMAARQWGLTPTVLNSFSSLSSTLQDGYHVVAAVQQDQFSPWGVGTSHEIVLKGYSNGYTYVSDPYNASNNGWYPIGSLWAEQSTDRIDTSGLGNPFVKITDI